MTMLEVWRDPSAPSDGHALRSVGVLGAPLTAGLDGGPELVDVGRLLMRVAPTIRSRRCRSESPGSRW